MRRTAILEALRDVGPISGRDLSVYLGWSNSTVSWWLTRLEREGLIFRTGTYNNRVGNRWSLPLESMEDTPP